MSINTVNNVRGNIDEMLSKIRDINSKSKAFEVTGAAKPATSGSFSNVMASMGNALDHVNSIQNTSDQVKNAYLLGDKNVSFSDVIISSQKSKLAFEGLVTVRNKILEAYKDIMNMPI